MHSSTLDTDTLLLDFQRLAARLAQAELLSRPAVARLMRTMAARRREAEETGQAFSAALLTVLLAVEDGTLQPDVDYVRGPGQLLALHVESVARTLFRKYRTTHTPRELRQLLLFGRRHHPDVILVASKRRRFGPAQRRRAIVIDSPAAQRLVGTPPIVPTR